MFTMISKIEKRNLVDEAYKQIRQTILSGTWSEGEKIPSEHQLCVSFNVSRVVVREALQRLRSERMIITYQGMGSFVANPQNFITLGEDPVAHPVVSLTNREFQDVMELRACLEYNAINRSAKEATDDDLLKIKQAAMEMEKAQDDLDAFNQADYLFHMEIVRSAHNTMFCIAMESCREQILCCLGEMNKLNDSRKWAVSLHHKIAQALCERKPQQAIRLLKQNGEYNSARMAEFFSG